MIHINVAKLATGIEQVTFDLTQQGYYAYCRMKSQFPEYTYSGERTVNLPEGVSIQDILDEYFNPEAFEIQYVQGGCVCPVCKSPEYTIGPHAWPYVCPECPYYMILFGEDK